MRDEVKNGDSLIDLTDLMENLFHGPTAHLADRFCIDPDFTGGIPCQELLDPAKVKQTLDLYCDKSYPGDDKRAAASFWAQWYFGFLVTPLLMLASHADCVVPSDPADIRLVMDQNFQPQRFVLTQNIARRADEDVTPYQRIEDFIEDHLAPMVFSLSVRSGVSAKVFWMSIAVIIDYTSSLFLRDGKVDFIDLNRERKLPNGERNPLFQPYRPSGSEATRTRRVCCLRYNLTGVERCRDCALQPDLKKTERPPVLGLGKSEE